MRIFVISMLVLINCALQPQNRTNVQINNTEPAALAAVMQKTASEVLTACNLAYWDNEVPRLSTISGCSTEFTTNINKLWNTAPFFCPNSEFTTDAVRMQNGAGYELRGIPVNLKTDKGAIQKEELVLVFDSQARLGDVFLGIKNQQYRSLMSEGLNVADVRRRQIILDFVENFRTAYNRKDLNYLENVFSEDALIIIGKVLQRRPGGEVIRPEVPTQIARLIKYSKPEYLKNLRNCFNVNKYIKVAFDSLTIVRHRACTDIYGVSLIQSWTSSSYSDKGYLFLLIDFRDENKPIIHVRAWQPKEYTTKKDIISLADFSIITTRTNRKNETTGGNKN